MNMRIKVRPTFSIIAIVLSTAVPAVLLKAAPQNPDPGGIRTESGSASGAKAPQQQLTHTVEEGDNLWDLARRYQTTVEELMQVNQMKTNRLRLGQVLLLPGGAVIPMPSTTHTVKEGDNLWDLARHYQTTVEELTELNQLKSNRLHLGQELQLPAPVEASSFLRKRQTGMTSQENPSNIENPLADVPSMNPQDVVLHETSDIAAIRSAILAGTSDPAQGQDPSAEAVAPALTLREQLVIAGFNYLGVRYRWNGTSEKRGFDCSGLVQRLYSLFSIDIPRSSREQFKIGEKIARAALQVGDLVFFSSRGGKIPTHVGIYIGGEQFLHAASRAKKVMVSNLTEEWYSKRFIGARRILDLWKNDIRISENKGN
jgi:peptidoglycan DL-endopeptidase LytE